jgi:hypothetical protein
MKTDELLKQAEISSRESSISCAEKTFVNEAWATEVFSSLKAKLFDIKDWNEHSLLSSYEVFDEHGKSIESEKLSAGVFVRISLKGTIKYDWIKVIDIYEAADEFIITVQPTYDPTEKKVDKSVISHFFTDESTNNFCLSREGEKVRLYVIGLNEKQNTSETKNTLETIRNVAVNLSTYLGIQNGEWEKFCHYFIEEF